MVLSFFRRSKHPVTDASELCVPTPEVQDAAFSDTIRLGFLEGTGFVSYEWLVDPKKQIVGYRLHWRPRGDHAATAAVQLQALVTTLGDALVDRRVGYALGRNALLLDVTAQALSGIHWCGLPPKHMVLRWRGEELCSGAPALAPLLKDLRERGFSIMLSGQVPQDKEVCECITHYDVGAADALSMSTVRSMSRRVIHPIATVMENWSGFEACAGRRVPVLVRPDVEPPPVQSQRGKLQPEALLIFRVMQMVQRNEDVREIEAALKHDAALTYRFLRHISSPAVGAGVEIESLRHAVSMLGYQRLFRWLTMMLATTDAKSNPPFLMKKAIIRGRFVELLGQSSLMAASDGDNLFLAGMFSAMDQLLGVSMAELLTQVQLPESVERGILDFGGAYGPFLELALACEAGKPGTEQLAETLLMSPSQVNAAHLRAIAWSQEIARGEY